MPGADEYDLAHEVTTLQRKLLSDETAYGDAEQLLV